jgi:Zn-dependent protease with chaperone function
MVLLASFGLASGEGAAQVELPFRIPGLPRSSPNAPASVAPQNVDAGKGLLPVKPNPNVANELKPDKLCQRVEENTDVWAKLGEYGGLQAQLRMQRLLASDFKYSDLTPQDQEMLRYIAYTTVWVPSWVENNLGRLYTTFLSGAGDGATRVEQTAMKRMQEQLQAFKSKISDFPGDVRLTLDTKAATGASARPGGLIALSRDFLNRMDENVAVRRLVLAHELSHLYKRHTLKELQYQLVSSSGGFDLARKLLGRFSPDRNNLFRAAGDAIALATTASELFEFVRSSQLSFQSDQELEADTCAVEWMQRINEDPGQLWQAFGELQTTQSSEDTDYLRTHPTTEDRRANMAKRLR